MQDLMMAMGVGRVDGGHRQGAEGVVAFARTDDGLELVGAEVGSSCRS